MLKIALVSPLPPLESGIADYSAELLPHLRRHAEVQLVVRDPAWVSPQLKRDYPVHPSADLPWLLQSGAVDVPVYQMGNSALHAHMLRYVAECPGVLVLHDLVLHQLFAHLTIENGWREDYRKLLLEEFGPQAKDWPERIWDGKWRGYDLYRIYFRLPFSKNLCRASRGVVVHSRYAASRVGRWVPPAALEVIPHGAETRAVDRATARARLGLDGAAFAVGICGGLSGNRLVTEAIAGFAQFAAGVPHARLLLAGERDPQVDARLQEHGLQERATYLGRPGWRRYLENLSALDAAITLRFPTCGETSGTGIRLMSVGVPFVTCDVDAFRELPDAVCVKLPVQRGLVPGIAEALRRWAADPGARRAAGAAGLRAIREQHRLDEAARALVAFAERRRRAPPTASRPAQVAATARPKVEAVIVGYNGRKFIGPSIQSLLDQDYPNLRITVIDNASTDGSAEWIRAQYPQVNVIASPANLGFAAGNNAVFARSDADWWFLLNQDAVARRDCVTELVGVGERMPEIAAVGAKMLMQRCPTILNSAGIRMNWAGWAVDRKIGEKDSDHSPIPEHIFGVCGGAMMIRASAVHRFGGFDEKFFMYFEDVDLCWRYRLAGQRIYYAPTAVVYHDWHGDRGAGDRAARRRFLCERNRWQSLFKNASLKTLVKLWPQLRGYDRLRHRVVRDALRRGENVAYFAMVGRSIRRAFWWNMLRLPATWLRRRGVQRLRKVTDGELRWFIEEGVSEPTHVGELEVIRDRDAAAALSRIAMGKSDRDSLGPGWHPVEGDPAAAFQWRWTKREAFFYLQPAADAARLCIRVGGRPLPGQVDLWVDGEHAGAQRTEGVPGSVMTWVLDPPVRAGQLVEGRVRPETFRPVDLGMGPDDRDLGVSVGEIWLE